MCAYRCLLQRYQTKGKNRESEYFRVSFRHMDRFKYYCYLEFLFPGFEDFYFYFLQYLIIPAFWRHSFVEHLWIMTKCLMLLSLFQRYFWWQWLLYPNLLAFYYDKTKLRWVKNIRNIVTVRLIEYGFSLRKSRFTFTIMAITWMTMGLIWRQK